MTPEEIRNLPENSIVRIQQLERQIRSLGGDPNDAFSEQPVQSQQSRLQVPRTGASGSAQAEAINNSTAVQASGLVTNDDEVTYIEAPMWYSWIGTSTSRQEDTSPDPASTRRHAFWSRTILDPVTAPIDKASPQIHVAHIKILWKVFLKYVHPLLGIFFDWEIEPIITKASDNPRTLSNEEQALVSAMVFLSVQSLPPEECMASLSQEKSKLLANYQTVSERALLLADYTTTTKRLTLQAFMIYINAMMERAHPAALFTLMGVASRTATRMGMHRDGSSLGLGAIRTEERRRIWWQLQYMEIAASRQVGSLALTLYADWDAALPLNINDKDVHSGTQELPAESGVLTNMSHCLWRYRILLAQREFRQNKGLDRGLAWMVSPTVPISAKDAVLDEVEKDFGTRFLQHCEPLKPLHVFIQIGIRQLLLAARITARQPSLLNAKISEMSREQRDEFLGLCTNALEYSILVRTTPSLRGFQWHSNNYFQWNSFVYVLLECHHRFDEDEVHEMWAVIRRVHEAYPELKTADHRPEMASVARITLAAWERHADKSRNMLMGQFETPEWISELRRSFNIPDDRAAASPQPLQYLGVDFDFDTFDWSVWDEAHMNAVNFS